ncbi:MbcA/ParS/Xre antitoxin family protein [Legionella spiritensis]|uniref:Antitoxin Xre/MbcA/ParS-like toxin-binding domain-containing protein n=1 Tax=Legionella spiritensis TaxID=452 RepID=A0A0W0ZB13_LEGSP|nr:MbcA/ParS/Xre antitoxin family protein [Legionella spiritensis]KTD66154.1 hypothetical protein Lspi_0217 [Legionella spiritensis]SNV43901.1 Uncharacterized conserved protein [Legionella spiritensis]
MNISENIQPRKNLVLTKAFCNLAKFYSLTGKDIKHITGISEAGFTRLNQGVKFISPDTKEGEMALLLLRVYRSLNSLVGNNHEKAKRWLNSRNQYFKKTPLEEMATVAGLVSVVNYLDAMRGKL